MHSLYMQIASLSNIAGKTKWLINHGFYIFSSVQNICPGTRVLKKKCPGNCMCTYVPDTWSPMCSLDVRICLGQIEPCSEIQTLRGHKRWGDVIKIDRQHLATCSDHHPTPFTPVLGSVNMPRSQRSSKETSFHVLKKAN